MSKITRPGSGRAQVCLAPRPSVREFIHKVLCGQVLAVLLQADSGTQAPPSCGSAVSPGLGVPELYIQLADAERESRVRVGFMGQTCTWHTSRPPRKARKRDLVVGLKEKGNDMVESQPGAATRDQTQSVTVMVGV